MMQRLGMLMLAATVALATVAHDWCRLTCANATHGAVVNVTASAEHAHCGQADGDSQGRAVSAAMPPCQIDSDITPATMVVKVAMIAPIAIPSLLVAPATSRIVTQARSASLPSQPRSGLVPLRI